MQKGVVVDRYSVIHTKLPREFVLLQGTGCRWRKCTFCDYHEDVSERPFEVNRPVLQQVTGIYGVLDVINSGSAYELDEETLQLIHQVVKEKHIHTLWFEMHYMYRHKLKEFAKRFAPVNVKFRCGVETFDPSLRTLWKKGISADVTPEDIARYFQGVCLLCGTDGENKEHIVSDIAIAKQYFEYFSINLFCNNHTAMKRDEALAVWFEKEVYPHIKDDERIEVLLNNTDLGVG
jgi:uncharacterized Fe-S cluster-containing MiaB family protein